MTESETGPGAEERGFVTAIEVGYRFQDDFRRGDEDVSAGGDWIATLAYADWLQDREDPRADGYRVMGEWYLRPNFYKWVRDDGDETRTFWIWYGCRNHRYHPTLVVDPASDLPMLWFNQLATVRPSGVIDVSKGTYDEASYTDCAAALDAAAWAWAALSAGARTRALRRLRDMRDKLNK